MVTIINPENFDMPIFNEDLEAEQGMPCSARVLKELMISHGGFLISYPEYNSFYSSLF
jgi:chromate reductase